MKVKSVAGRDIPVTTRGSGRREAFTVSPGDIIDLPVEEGVAICKFGPFVPADEDAKKIYERSLPAVEDVKVRRKETGTEADVVKDLNRQKKVEGGIKNG